MYISQFGFMPGTSTVEPIFEIPEAIKFRESSKKRHMVFIDLVKAYYRVLRAVLWEVLRKKEVAEDYISTAYALWSHDGGQKSIWGV